jgi:phosphomannomutase
MTTATSTLRERALAWIAGDPDPETRAELRALVEAGDEAALAERFAGRLEFGTAGIRGVLGGGPMRMNQAVARLVGAGLGRVVLDRFPERRTGTGGAESAGAGAGAPVAALAGVAAVVGYDMRRRSREMALEVCGALAALGLRVHLLDRPSPTPLLAFSVLALGAATGVMVTASHNPPEYNGIKVYWQNGVQIVPPVDAEISAAIEAAGAPAAVAFLPADAARRRGLLSEGTAALADRYVAAIGAQTPPVPWPVTTAAAPGIVYTPLHGVALELARRALAARGIDGVSVVAEQAAPDGSFPTIRQPNPEDPEPLQRAIAQASREGAALVLANDPDGDRLAAAVRRPDGTYRILSGDHLGCLLGHQLLELQAAAGRLHRGCFVVTTVVSSSLLSRLAALHGVRCELTLTGLKWIWNRALELERQGGTFLFGYEEALGYSVGGAVRDKDGISAAMLLAEMARGAAAAGGTLLDRLAEIEARAGVVETRPMTLPLAPADAMARVRAIVARLRDGRLRDLAGLCIERLSDFAAGERLDLATGRATPIELPATPLAVLHLAGDREVRLRPSGTEPKLKVYLEAAEPPAPPERAGAARARATAALDAMEAAVHRLIGAAEP